MNIKRMQKGFTLIELMIVVAIVGILASLALPAYSSYTKKAKFAEVVSAVAGVKIAIEVCYATKGDLSDCDTAAKSSADLTGAAAGNYVTGVTITAADNSIVAASAIAGTTSYTLTPTVSAGSLTWAGVCVPVTVC